MTWKLSGPSQIITHDETLQIERQGTKVPTDVVYVDGKPVKHHTICFQITCNVQPLNGRDLLNVPEADRFKEQYWVYMNQRQRPLETEDIVIRVQGGKKINFVVQSAENWGSFSRCMITRIDTGPNATP